MLWIPPVIDVSALQLLLMVVTGWLERREREAVAYLIAENRVVPTRKSVFPPIHDIPVVF